MEDDFSIERYESVEIDYSDYGFVLRTTIDKEAWKVIPNDPDEDNWFITSKSNFPLNAYSVTITADMFEQYENIRKQILKDR